MSIKDSGGFNVRRRPDLDVSGMIAFVARIHVGGGQWVELLYSKSDLQYIRALIGRELKADKEESK